MTRSSAMEESKTRQNHFRAQISTNFEFKSVKRLTLEELRRTGESRSSAGLRPGGMEK